MMEELKPCPWCGAEEPQDDPDIWEDNNNDVG